MTPVLVACVLLEVLRAGPARAEPATGAGGMVVASQVDAAAAGHALLEAGGVPVDVAAEPIRFHSGKTEFVLDAASVRNIAVDDHYCYVHFRHGDGYAKRDLAMPLRDLSALLPDNFVQVHRSHIVNLRYVQAVKRRKRSVRLVLPGEFEVPVSRYRLDEVLPRLRRLVVVR